MAHAMINKETTPLKIGKIILLNSWLSSPKVDSIVFVRVTIETLAEIRLISLMLECKWSFFRKYRTRC